MIRKVKAKFEHLKLEATLHGDEEYILKAGNRNRTSFKVTNMKWATFETIDVWPDHPIDSQRDVLRQFQRMLFQGAAAALGPDIFCEALGLDPEVKATEVRFDVFNETARQLKNVLGQWVLNDKHFCETAMIIITKLKKEGIDCGLNLEGK